MRKSFLFLFFLLTCLLAWGTGGSFAQQTLGFYNYTIKNGLSSNIINSFAQDHLGYIWIGTNDGLCRFDGLDFKHYRTTDGEGGIGSNQISCLYSDSNSRLWVACKNDQLYTYSYDDNKFKQLVVSGKGIDVSNIRTIYEDSRGRIWFGALHGLFYYLPEKQLTMSVDLQKSSGLYINSIVEDRNQNIWVGTGFGLFKLDKALNVLKHYTPETHPDALQENWINKLIIDSENNFWICSGISFGIFNPKTEKQLYPEVYKQLFNDDNTVVDVAIDKNNRFWFATRKGLYASDSKKTKLLQYEHNPQDKKSLLSNLIKKIFIDKNNNYWIGTWRKGVSMFNYNSHYLDFKNFSKSYGTFSLSSDQVTAIEEDNNGLIWVGTEWGGVNVINPLDNSVEVYKAGNKKIPILRNLIHSIYRGPDNNIWIGTQGLEMYNPTKKILKHYNLGVKVGDISVRTIEMVDDRELFYGTKESVYKFDTKKGEVINDVMESIPVKSINSLLYDSVLYIGTSDGFYIYDEIKNSISRQAYFENYKSLKSENVTYIYRDNEDKILVATDAGLHSFNNDSGFKYHSEVNKLLPSKYIHGIVEDNDDNLWLTTNNGLVKIEKNENDSLTSRVFDEHDGLPAKQFNTGAILKTTKGNIVVGGVYGLSIFDPDKLLSNPLTPNVYISKLVINNNEVLTGEKLNDRLILDKSIQLTKEIELTRDERIVEFEFTAIQYISPTKAKFRYKLEGFHDDWITTNADKRFATFTSLPPNDYTLRVQACNNDGKWSDQEAQLLLIVRPAWWQTLWFKISLAVLLTVFIILGFHIRLYTLQQQKKILSDRVQKRTSKLREKALLLQQKSDELSHSNKQLEEYQQKLLMQNEKIEKQKLSLEQKNQKLELNNIEIVDQSQKIKEMAQKVHEADQNKLKFFTNISHEFKTPLSLIFLPIERLIKEYRTDKYLLEQLQVIDRNAKYLYKLINELLELRKLQSNNANLRLNKIDVIKNIKGIYEAFAPVAKDRGINFVFNNSYETFEMLMDVKKIEKIVYNLLSNAFKHVNKGGTIEVNIFMLAGNTFINNNKVTASDQVFSLSVSNTGKIIEKEMQEKIFNRFYKIQEADENNSGLGIGLSIVKEYISLFNGEIKVNSENGETKFSVFIPVNLERYNRYLIEGAVTDKTPDFIDKRYEVDPELRGEHEIDHDDRRSRKEFPLVLLVDDNRELRTFLKSEMNTNFIVIEAINGEDALGKAKKYKPDIVVSDVLMPVMDGLRFCENLKSLPDLMQIPVILLTAKSDGYSNKIAFEKGADAFVSKPFIYEVLESRIFNLIKNRDELQKKYTLRPDFTPGFYTNKKHEIKFLEKVYQIICQNISNEDFRVEELAAKVAMSRIQLYRKIHNLTGSGPSTLIRKIRLSFAKKLIEAEHEKPIAEIALTSGFQGISHFNRSFKEEFKISPGAYKRRLVNND